jgi:hypothetical protein
MLPVIRRIRRPLLDPEPATSFSEAATSPPKQRHENPDSDLEKRSDYVQFQSDSAAETPEAAPVASQQIAEHPAKSSQPTSPDDRMPCPAPNPQLPNAWSRQPSEPPVDYQLFVSWLQLPAPRTFRKAATAFKCSPNRLRRLSSRHHWKTRTAAFDHQRANAASDALDRFLQNEATDWQERAQRFRIQEWLLHEEILQGAVAAAHELKRHPRRASLADIARLFELAALLGRRAVGLPLDPDYVQSALPPTRPDAEEALRKIYGDDENGCSSSAWSHG